MPSITKTFHTSTGHRLADHPGKCRNLHGHNYEIEIELVRRHGRLDVHGMVVDFDVVKQIAGTVIDDEMDHQCLLHIDDPLLSFIGDDDEKYEELGINATTFIPTAENIGHWLFSQIESRAWPEGVELRRIKVQETPSAYAEVFHS